MRFYIYIFSCCIIYFCSCASLKTSYVISSEIPNGVWRDNILNAGNMSYRKLKPGDVIIIDCFYSNIANSQASMPPVINKMIIPVRAIGPLGYLKEYEKNFLMAFIATNAANTFSFSPSVPDGSLRELWNYVMNNLYAVADNSNTDFFRVQVDFTNINQLPVNNYFHPVLDGNAAFGKRDILQAFLSQSSFRSFFNLPHTGTNSNTKFYNNTYDSDPTRLHSYFSYTIHINGYKYEEMPLTSETSLWSVYDWLYAAKSIRADCSVSQISSYKKIKFYKHEGKWSVITSGTPGWQVRYDLPPDSNGFLTGGARKKEFAEKDLLNLFPVNVKNIKKIIE